MSATYTFDAFCTLDGFGSFTPDADWGGYWGKDGPEFVERRRVVMEADQRLVLGADTFRQWMGLLGAIPESEIDPVNGRMRSMPTTVISTTLEGPFDWPDAAVESGGDAVAIVRRLKETSAVPLRSHGSLTLNRALLAAGLVDVVQVSIMPVISGQTGAEPIFAGAPDFDLELVESKLYDGRIQELTYRPTLHGS